MIDGHPNLMDDFNIWIETEKKKMYTLYFEILLLRKLKYSKLISPFVLLSKVKKDISNSKFMFSGSKYDFGF
jgi:hypothetical protein